MRFREDPERYLHDLREGLPIVLNVLAITVVEHVLDATLSFGLTPIGFVLQSPDGEPIWFWLIWGMFGGTLLLYVLDLQAWEVPYGVLILATSTAGLLVNVGELVRSLAERAGGEGMLLLVDGSLIWASNVLIFTVWYWLIDGGGYLRRTELDTDRPDFLFPLRATPQPTYPRWRPRYFDYLFLALTTSTAFGPTDTPPLSGWAKLLQGTQA